MNQHEDDVHQFNLKFAFARGYYDGRTLGKPLDLFDESDLREEYVQGTHLGVIHSAFFKEFEGENK